jgi:hypothetical protein
LLQHLDRIRRRGAARVAGDDRIDLELREHGVVAAERWRILAACEVATEVPELLRWIVHDLLLDAASGAERAVPGADALRSERDVFDGLARAFL